MPNLKLNIFWNVIRVGSNMLFPIITLPYVNRVLGAYNIGLYNYINSIVTYFILFASLGFPLYGTREVTKVRDNNELEVKVNSIFTSNIISSFIVMIFYLTFVKYFFNSDVALCLVLGVAILLNSLSFDWFFQGVEEFKYITIRSVVFKLASIIALFLLVKSRDDIVIYAIINTIALFGSNIANCWKINSYLKLRFKFKIRDIIQNIRGASMLFIGSVIASLYTQINAVMLGSLGSVVAVAYYTTGDKFVQMSLQILNSFSMAVMPRISYMKRQTDNERQTYILQKKVFNMIMLISVPMSIGLFVTSEEIINVFAGHEFLPAVFVLKSLSFNVILIPLSIFFSFHVLYPIGKEKYSNYCTLTASFFNIFLNVILIPVLSYKAVVISILVSESIVMTMHYYYSKRYFQLSLIEFFKYKIFFPAILAGIISSQLSFGDSFINLLFKIFFFGFIYTLCLLILREEVFMSFINNIRQIFIKK